MRHVHQQALRIDSFLPLHSNYSSLGMGSATLVSLLSGIFPMPKGTPNKMKHKEIAMFVPVFHAPTYLGLCSISFHLFVADPTLIGQTISTKDNANLIF